MKKLTIISNELSAMKKPVSASFCPAVDLPVEYLHTTYDFKGLEI